MKKGFTLIELLAVIVILAIIALIATPIILGIINDARKESNERSAELYAAAVKNAIASYQLTHPNAPTKFSDLDVEIDGDVVCTTEELYEDGSFYITGCKVNGTEVEYTYGEKQEKIYIQVYKPQYYCWISGSIGGDLPSDAEATVEELNPGYLFYFGLDADANNKVTTVYACFTRNGAEYCLKANDTEAYETNANIIKDAYADVVDTNCYFDNDRSSCSADELHAMGYSDGRVYVGNSNTVCYTNDGSFSCNGL